jgi:ABC-type branched-subunit amino acid transport system permease subunit
MASPPRPARSNASNFRWAGPVAFVALAALPFWGNDYHVTVAVNLCVTLILTLSLNLVVGYSGQFHLSHVTFFGAGAYTSAILAKDVGLSPWLCLFGSIAVSALLAALIGAPVTRLKGLYLAVATLAFSLFMEVVVNQASSITGGGYGIQQVPSAYLGSLKLSGKSFYAIALIMLGLTFFVLRNILRSKFGREIIATRDHPDAAAATGINPALIRLMVLIIAASLAAVGGWVHTFYHLTLNPILLNPEWTFVWFFMVLVGGIGDTVGVVIGTLLLSLVPEFLGFATGQTIFGIGVLMILVTLFAPRGLSGLIDGVLQRADARHAN